MNLKKILASALTFLSLWSVHQFSAADALIASGSNGRVQFYNVGSTSILEEDKKEVIRLCSEGGGTDCKVLGQIASNQAAVLARGEGGFWISSDPNPKIAMNEAVVACGKKYKNCFADYVFWSPYVSYAAFAEYSDKDGNLQQTYFAFDHGSKEDAEIAALTECKKLAKHDCKLSGSWNGDVFYAYAASEDSNGHGLSTTLEGAKSTAMEACKEHSLKKMPCKILSKYHNRAPTPEPKNYQSVYKQIEAGKYAQSGGVRRQHVTTQQRNVVSCHNQCMNGDCIRTFPDGRKERWQAPRVYDASTNDWKWDTNSCGG